MLGPLRRRTRLGIAFLYGLFAAVSTAANLGMQAGVHAVLGRPNGIILPMIFGTGTGLLVKYVLDKRWIFNHITRSAIQDVGTFVIYATMGLVTTAIFWMTELAFHKAFGEPRWSFIGGAIGLAIGYVVKYQLDKRFTFRDA